MTEVPVHADDPGRPPSRFFLEPASDTVAAQTGEVGKLVEQRRLLSEQLQALALDRERTAADRHAAIFALGDLGGGENLAFLAKHLALNLPVDLATSAEGQARAWPCRVALAKAGWYSLPAVLESLKQQRSDEELLFSGSHLARCPLPVEAVSMLLRDELKRAEDPTHRENVRRVLESVFPSDP
ncbi:MAG: hypothetical protein RIC55_14255 [Pirellulaceae bacterium]